ncbi:MAG: dependent oxidoreductase [Clostridiales bacterium]|jgi:heterodisulfide reductase subunit A|nr:dependent oxidoreductase [Clostridiales bacterium]
MNHALIIGGGLAGCTSALELADSGITVTLLEKTDRIGGKVRSYGCKATDRCLNCGLCLAGDLWNRVEKHERIRILTSVQLKDIQGKKGNFKIINNSKKGFDTITGITSIIVATGFDEFSSVSSGSFEHESADGIISGYSLEKLIAGRRKAGVFSEPPSSIAFIQCFGSRDVQEKAEYCSRVCCGYSTRAAKVFRHYYPDTKITFFFMDLQRVEAGNYMDTLAGENIEFIRCRPARVIAGKPARIAYEEPGTSGVVEREFDFVFLSEGIHPSQDTDKIAELCMLGLDENGFLKYVKDGDVAGIYLTGCACGPKRIEEVRSEALTTARRLLANI